MAEQPPAGVFLQRMREQRGLSRQAAGKLLRANDKGAHWGQVETGQRRPRRGTLLEMAEALGLTAAERDELLALAGFAPVRVDQARRHLEIAAEQLGMSPAQRDRLLAFAGVTTELAQSGHALDDAAASDPAPGVRTAGVAWDDLPPEDREAIRRLARDHAHGTDLAAPGPTQGGTGGAGDAAHGRPAGRSRRAAGDDA